MVISPSTQHSTSSREERYQTNLRKYFTRSLRDWTKLGNGPEVFPDWTAQALFERRVKSVRNVEYGEWSWIHDFHKKIERWTILWNQKYDSTLHTPSLKVSFQTTRLKSYPISLYHRHGGLSRPDRQGNNHTTNSESAFFPRRYVARKCAFSFCQSFIYYVSLTISTQSRYIWRG